LISETEHFVVLDTNVVLDLLVFDDPAAQPLKAALAARRVQWIATQAMREELERVLGYAQIVPRLADYRRNAADVLAQFDQHAHLVTTAPKAQVSCSDADDQKFIDLAVMQRAALLSKDSAVLRLKKRLALLGVLTAKAMTAPA
jgi:putative PIN family toxin of toxin-antitoxin system